MLKRQEAIENRLAARHVTEGTVVLYDVSSATFEGRTCPIAKIGHARDGVKVDYQRGVATMISPRLYCERVMAKGFADLDNEDAQIGPDLALRAAAELYKMTAQEDDEAKWARIVATQSKIVAAFRKLPPQYQDEILDEVDGRKPTLVIEAGTGEIDPFDDEDFDDDDNDE